MPPVSVSDVLAEARTWIDTPFRHQGRDKGIGVDCAGVVVGVARALEIEGWDVAAAEIAYSRLPDGVKLRRICDELMVRVERREIAPGTVALMRWRINPQHLGIVAEPQDGRLTMIHALASLKACKHHSIDETWGDRIIGVYRLRGVAY